MGTRWAIALLWGWGCSLKVLFLSALLSLLLRLWSAFLLKMDEKFSPRFGRVELESSENGVFKLIVGLEVGELAGCLSTKADGSSNAQFTFFLYCLWIASKASLIVTPFRFRAVTSRPVSMCSSILLTGGSVSIFLR